MRRKLENRIYVVMIIFLFVLKSNAYASQTYIIDPSDDGNIYSNGLVITDQYVTTNSDLRGILEFPIYSIAEPISGALLFINPYALPLHDLTIDVYGYESADGLLTSSDYNAGEFLDIWSLPSNLNFGEEVSFDVTSYLTNVHSNYVGFNLRTDDLDTFSSLEYNEGNSSQLHVTVVPEPISSILVMIGGATLGFRRFKKKLRK